MLEHIVCRCNIHLDVPVHVVTPGRETFSGREHIPTHEIKLCAAQDIRRSLFQQGQVRVSTNGGNDRTLLNTTLKQVEGLTEWGRSRRDWVWPIDAFVLQSWPDALA